MDRRMISRGTWYAVCGMCRTTNHESRITNHGLTLIELLIAITISSILAGTTVLMLKSSLDAYLFSQDEALTQKIIDETLEEISSGTYTTWGVKDALEITEAKVDFISFIPLWIDTSHRPSGMTAVEQEFVLNRPFKAGAPLPILEYKRGDRGDFTPVPLKFVIGEDTQSGACDDMVILFEPIPSDAQVVEIVFHPDSASFPDTIMNIRWSAQKGCFVRQYANKVDNIPPKVYKEFKLTNATFQYFDNTNTEILPDSLTKAIAADLLSSITAVRLNLYISPTKFERGKPRQASSFVNLRNTRSFGSGIILRGGTRLKIPDSKHIRTLSIGNITGVKEGNVIQIEARPEQGNIWRVTLQLGMKDNLAVIKKYIIDYPPGMTVYSEAVNLTTDLPLNLLTLGGNGRYDYDFDKDVENVVDLEGNVVLVVTQMDCAGAALFVRP